MRRSLKTKRFSDLFDEFVSKKKLHSCQEKTLSSIWENIVGYNILTVTQSISLNNNNTLNIIIIDSKVQKALILQKEKLLKKIQRFNPSIASLVIK